MPTDKKLKTIGFRANEGELAVLEEFYKRLKRRNPYLTFSDMFREMFEINPMTVTTQDRDWLREQWRILNADDHPGDDARPLTPGHG